MSITRHKIAGKNVTVLLHSTIGEPRKSILQYIAKRIVAGYKWGEFVEGQWHAEDAEEIDWQAIAKALYEAINQHTYIDTGTDDLISAVKNYEQALKQENADNTSK